MSEQDPSRFFRIDEIERAHATAHVVDAMLYENQILDDMNAAVEESDAALLLTPVEQAELFLKRKDQRAQNLETVIGVAEEVYSWEPEQAAAMTKDEFLEYTSEYFQLYTAHHFAAESHGHLSGLASRFAQTNELGSRQDNEQQELDLDTVKTATIHQLWGGLFAYSCITMAEKSYVTFRDEWSRKPHIIDPRYDMELHTLQYDIQHWLDVATSKAELEKRIAEINLCQHILAHAEVTSKSYKQAKNTLLYYRSIDPHELEGAWVEYVHQLTDWYNKYDQPLADTPLFGWSDIATMLSEPDEKPWPSERIYSDEEVRDIPDLAKKLEYFYDRSIDASVGVRLINEGYSNEVAHSFQVFEGDLSGIAMRLLEKEGPEFILLRLSNFYGLDSFFAHTLLDDWAETNRLEQEEWQYAIGPKAPPHVVLDLHYATDQMQFFINNLESFDGLDTAVAEHIISFMYTEIDFDGISIELIRTMMKYKQRFTNLDGLSLAKHIFEYSSTPNLTSEDVVARLLDVLDLPDTAEAHEFINWIVTDEDIDLTDVVAWRFPINDENLRIIRGKLGDPTFTPPAYRA